MGEARDVPLTRLCRYCFEPEGPGRPLIAPCQCDGSVRYVHRACLERWRLAAGNSDNAARCEICHTEYEFVPDLCQALRFRAQICAVWLNFALWGSVLAWLMQALLLCSADIKKAYGLTSGLSLGKALLVGWYALFGLLGALTLMAIFA